MAEAGEHRLHAGVVLWLAGGTQRSHRPPVEAVEEGDDLVALLLGPVEPGELDRRLVRLRPAVAEEALAREVGALAELLGELALGLHVPGVRHMDELPDLLAHCGDDARRAVPDQVAAPAREEVDVPVALRIPDERPL